MSNFENVVLSVLSALLVVSVTCVIYCKWAFNYWKRRNLQCFEEPTIPFGNDRIVWKEKFVLANIVKTAYDLGKRKGCKHVGGFVATLPFYVTIDPDIIKCVLQQGSEHFSQRFYDDCKSDDAFSANLAFVSGDRWKYLRAKLTPAFTPGKIKLLLEGIIECAQQMQKEVGSGNKTTVDISKVSLCYFADVIGVSAYGLECNSFKNPDSKFIIHAKNLIDISSKYRLMKISLKTLFPKFSEWLRISIYDKKSSDFFINLAKETAKFRKDNAVVRKDLFQLMLDAETELNLEEMDDEESESSKIIKDLASQVFLFFVAGFETSSLILTYCLLELAQNFTIQDRLREEIDRVVVKHKGKITYDAIIEMTYMTQVLDETLRKYPPVPFLTRRCTKDLKICETTIEKGVMASISTLGLHRDPDHFPDPEKFDPERFSEENKHKIKPFTYLPFGEGPRICPAYRFGLMQIKVGLTVLLQHYVFSLNKGTKLPLEMSAGSFTLMPKSQILLDMKNRNVHE